MALRMTAPECNEPNKGWAAVKERVQTNDVPEPQLPWQRSLRTASSFCSSFLGFLHGSLLPRALHLLAHILGVVAVYLRAHRPYAQGEEQL